MNKLIEVFIKLCKLLHLYIKTIFRLVCYTLFFQKNVTELCPLTAVKISSRIHFPLRLIEFDPILYVYLY